MIVAGSASPLLLSSAGGYNLTKSLRFRSSASAYLDRTPASASNRKTWTWSAWVKRGAIADGVLFSVGTSGSSYFNLRFQDNSGVQEFSAVSENPSTDITLRTSQQFRDPSAWYHLVFVLDTTQATSSNRAKFYVNGSQVTAFSSATYPSQNADLLINNNQAHNIARRSSAADLYFDGYMTEINFVDGQALTPSSFGQTSPTTGVWQPKRYTGTYGTNGFYLPFTNTTSTATLGNDFSGNNNTWTVNNISLTSGVTYDSMNDVPTLTNATTANYATLNPLNSTATISSGNLNSSAGSSYIDALATIACISGEGKWYFEGTLLTLNLNEAWIGITRSTNNGLDHNSVDSYRTIYQQSGTIFREGTGIGNTNTGITYAVGDVIGVALDSINGSISFYKNNTLVNTTTNSVYSTNSWFFYTGQRLSSWAVNFGQRPFAYTPPTGFVALNTFNLPTPTIGATASTVANKYFDALLYTGNGSASQRTDISWANMQPDMVWIKNRTSANNHVLHDDIRGTNAALQPNLTNATDSPVGFGTDGFGFDGVANQLRIFTSDGRYNTNGNAYVTWGWKGSGAAGVTNTAGSITSTVSANTTAGFSIVTYTGTGANATVGHGLGVAPSMIIAKCRSAGGTYWIVGHSSLSSWNNYLNLNTTGSFGTLSSVFNSTAPTSTVFSLGSDSNINGSGATNVAYCFAQVAGYSAFGSYTGNGSSDGVFIYTGFRPRFVMYKNASYAGTSWAMLDSSRNTYNVLNARLFADGSDAENTATTPMDFTSNGFKVRSTNDGVNRNGDTIIYMAFAESPFKYANAR